MKTAIKNLMTKLPHTIGKDLSLEKAKNTMRELRCHHLPVLDGGKLVGVISDRDLAFAANLNESDLLTVDQIMMEEPIVVAPSKDLAEVLQVMLKNRINSVIVSAEAPEPWGIFTTTDLIKHVIKTL